MAAPRALWWFPQGGQPGKRQLDDSISAADELRILWLNNLLDSRVYQLVTVDLPDWCEVGRGVAADAPNGVVEVRKP